MAQSQPWETVSKSQGPRTGMRATISIYPFSTFWIVEVTSPEVVMGVIIPVYTNLSTMRGLCHLTPVSLIWRVRVNPPKGFVSMWIPLVRRIIFVGRVIHLGEWVGSVPRLIISRMRLWRSMEWWIRMWTRSWPKFIPEGELVCFVFFCIVLYCMFIVVYTCTVLCYIVLYEYVNWILTMLQTKPYDTIVLLQQQSTQNPS